MFTKIKNKFKAKPQLYYAMSIAATWAGVGSLIVGMEMLQEYGIIPFLLWALGNTLACIVFGIFAPMIPKLRYVFRSKAMKIIVGLMCPFQIWLSLNGIQSIFQSTPISGVGTWVAYGLAIFFVLLLFRYGMIRNVLTDHYGWIVVYAIGTALTVGAIVFSKGQFLPIAWGAENVGIGIEKMLYLIPGPFLFPYFFEILDYNDKNEDGTRRTNVRKSFILGGMLFGAYLIFTFLLGWTKFSPALSIVKAIFVVLIAASSLSSFIYSIYLTFGKGLGLAINIASVAAWQFLIPLGVMGVWSMMSQIRIVIVVGAIVAAFILYAAQKRKGKEVRMNGED